MKNAILDDLRQRIESAPTLDGGLLSDAVAALKPVFDAAELPEPGPEPSMTARALFLVDNCVPGWTISLKGKAVQPDGHWHCTLRQGTARDNDEFIGTGKGATPAQAIIAALLRVAEMSY